MVVIVEHSAASLHQPIQRPRDPDAEALHAARKSEVRIGLDQQMEVIAQHGELDDAEAKALARTGDAVLDEPEASLTAQIPRRGNDAQGDEHRSRLVETRPLLVRHSRSGTLAFPPRAFPLAAFLRNLQ